MYFLSRRATDPSGLVEPSHATAAGADPAPRAPRGIPKLEGENRGRDARESEAPWDEHPGERGQDQHHDLESGSQSFQAAAFERGPISGRKRDLPVLRPIAVTLDSHLVNSWGYRERMPLRIGDRADVLAIDEHTNSCWGLPEPTISPTDDLDLHRGLIVRVFHDSSPRAGRDATPLSDIRTGFRTLTTSGTNFSCLSGGFRRPHPGPCHARSWPG